MPRVTQGAEQYATTLLSSLCHSLPVRQRPPDRAAFASLKPRRIIMTTQSPPPTDTQEKQTAASVRVVKALRAKVTIETLPVTRAFRRQKRLVQDRGELALIEDGLTIHTPGLLFAPSGKGISRRACPRPKDRALLCGIRRPPPGARGYRHGPRRRGAPEGRAQGRGCGRGSPTGSRPRRRPRSSSTMKASMRRTMTCPMTLLREPCPESTQESCVTNHNDHPGDENSFER